MRALIWFGCMFALSLITTACKTSGIILGGIPMMLLGGGAVWVARKLCKNLDEQKKEKVEEKREVSEVLPPVAPAATPAPALHPEPVQLPQDNSCVVPIIVSETEKQELKNLAVIYLPRNLDQIGAQRQIIRMLAACVPSVQPCVNEADREIWPMVEGNALPMNQAVARCANKANQLIGITIIENLKLESQGEENLLKAWIVLDYYSYLLKPDYSANIRKLQDHIAVVLKRK